VARVPLGLASITQGVARVRGHAAGNNRVLHRVRRSLKGRGHQTSTMTVFTIPAPEMAAILASLIRAAGEVVGETLLGEMRDLCSRTEHMMAERLSEQGGAR
jgi:hypothetical protein